ncbi:MAG: Nif3-like dinuclear metal center hexameric protein [Helicobacteraceae bacterium]|jgi:dinuclear metal center YbgI/SA1388 family protein|nr:Nif3-like dinuclear metal center hexameric protein [Helicobacteraceae bacterium]
MLIRDLLKILGEISPFETQESWDNSGLIVGDFSADAGDIFISLECDQNALNFMPNNSTLIAHHPLIFSPIKSLNFAEYPANLLRSAIAKNINVIAMHTNFDKSHLNRYVAEKILKFNDITENDFICYAKTAEKFDDLLTRVNSAIGSVKSFVKPPKKSEYKIAICCGSGGSFAGKIDADILITGDLKYHDAVRAASLEIGLIDAGHYETERFFGEVLRAALSQKGISAIIAPLKSPFG